MIAKIWSGESKLYWLLIPFAFVYSFIVKLRKLLYQFGLFKSWHAPVPVIIVGNLSVGGNGKTPLVIYLIEQLRLKGYKVGVVSRGYGGTSKNYPIIVTDLTPPSLVGDEPFLVYQRTKVPFAVSPKRSEAVKCLLANYQLDCIITDDGLQHYALARDIEIVVMDGKRGFGNGWSLPAGPMRELPTRLNSVDYLVINGETHQCYKGAYTMKLISHNAVNLLTNEQKPVTALSSVCAMAGIGDPERFFSMLRCLHVDLVKTIPFMDHYAYSKAQLLKLTKPNHVLLMTEKDAVKCLAFAENNWWYLPIDAQLPASFIDDLCLKLNKLRQ